MKLATTASPERRLMHLEANIVIRRPPEQVWRFLGDISNLPKWDRGVANVERKTPGAMGVGSEFDTLADPSGTDVQSQGRMSYRIAEVVPEQRWCLVELTSRDGNARYFKSASWAMRAVDAPEGTLLTCSADFVLRMRYWLVVVGNLSADPIARVFRDPTSLLTARCEYRTTVTAAWRSTVRVAT